MYLSVVIPLYNKQNTIQRAVQSVLKQTFQQFEIIIVNDGSTDNSVAKATEIHDERIRIIHQENQGVSVARNTGIENATYNWIAFLDADDEWLPEFLETVTNLHTKYPECNVLATSYYLCNSKGEKRNIKLKRIKFSGEDGIMENYFEVATYSSPPFCSISIAINKVALLEIGGFPVGIKSGEDLLTWAKLAVKNKIAYSTNILSIYNFVSDTNKLWIPCRAPQIPDKVGAELKILFKKQSLQKKYLKRYISLWHKMRASSFVRLAQNKDAITEIFTSYRYNIFNFKVLFYIFLLFFPLKYRNKLFKFLIKNK